jgi:hypothetical protein
MQHVGFDASFLACQVRKGTNKIQEGEKWLASKRGKPKRKQMLKRVTIEPEH